MRIALALAAAVLLFALPSQRISIYYTGGFRDRAPQPHLLDAARAGSMLERVRGRLASRGLAVLVVDTDDLRPTVREAGGLRIAFVPAADDAAERMRDARAAHPADVYVLVATTRHLHRLDGCGADAVIPARLAAEASADEVTRLPDGTPVAPCVDGRRNLGCLQIEERGLLRRRLFHARVVQQVWRQAEPVPHRPQAAAASLLLGCGPAGLTHDLAYFRESPMGDYVTDVMREATGADVALVNHLAVRAGLEGPVGRADVARAIPFPDQIATLDVKGDLLRALLRQNVREDRAFMQLSGLRVRYTPGRPESVEAWLGDEPLEDARTYRVATIDYVLGARRYALLRGTRLRWTGAYLPELVADDLARRRAVPFPQRRSEIRGVHPEQPTDPRPPDLGDLRRGDLDAASRSLAQQAEGSGADRGACLLFLGYTEYLRGHLPEARAAWARALRFPRVRERAQALLRLAR